MKDIRRMFMSDGGAGGAGGAGGGTGTGSSDGGAGGGQGAGSDWKFDDFAAKLDETTRTALTAHIENSSSGLKNALNAERDQRKALEKQIGELRAKAEKGSELEKQLESMQNSIRDGGMQTAFYEAASAAGCRNIKLAWAAAQLDRDTYFKRDNTPDIEAVKAAFPELFAAPAPNAETRTNGGAGSNGGAGGGSNNPNQQINDAIRKAAGFKV